MAQCQRVVDSSRSRPQTNNRRTRERGAIAIAQQPTPVTIYPIISKRDPEGHVTQIEYNSAGHLSFVTDAAGRQLASFPIF